MKLIIEQKGSSVNCKLIINKGLRNILNDLKK